MKTEIVYFSATGNTWLVATNLAEQLKARGAKVKLAPLEKQADMPSPDVNLFGLCFPVHGPGMPVNVYEYIHTLKEGQGQNAFVLTTASMYGGSTAYDAAMILKQKNYTPVLAYNIIMPMNLCSLYFFPIYPILCPVKIPAPAEAERIKAQALSKIPTIAGWLIEGQRKLSGGDPISRLITNAFSLLFRQALVPLANKHRRLWTVDNEKCSLCELCVRICPRHNIRLTNKGIEFMGRCIICGRCFSFCPEEAILFAHRTKNYLRYPGVGHGYQPPLLDEHQ